MKLLVSFITLLLLGFSQAQRQTLVSSEENDWSLLRALDDGNQQFEPAEADPDFWTTWIDQTIGSYTSPLVYNGPAFTPPNQLAPFSAGSVPAIQGGSLIDTPPDAVWRYGYFLKVIDGGASGFQNLELRILARDGAIVYLNGHYLGASGNTLEREGESPIIDQESDGQTWVTRQGSRLRDIILPGPNLLAVVAGRATGQTEDFGFKVELTGEPGIPPITPVTQTKIGNRIHLRWATAVPQKTLVRIQAEQGGGAPEIYESATSTRIHHFTHEIPYSGTDFSNSYSYSILKPDLQIWEQDFVNGLQTTMSFSGRGYEDETLFTHEDPEWHYLQVRNNNGHDVDPALIDRDFHETWFTKTPTGVLSLPFEPSNYDGPAFSQAATPIHYGVAADFPNAGTTLTPSNGGDGHSIWLYRVVDGGETGYLGMELDLRLRGEATIYLNGQRLHQTYQTILPDTWPFSADDLRFTRSKSLTFQSSYINPGPNLLAILVHNSSESLGFSAELRGTKKPLFPVRDIKTDLFGNTFSISYLTATPQPTYLKIGPVGGDLATYQIPGDRVFHTFKISGLEENVPYICELFRGDGQLFGFDPGIPLGGTGQRHYREFTPTSTTFIEYGASDWQVLHSLDDQGLGINPSTADPDFDSTWMTMGLAGSSYDGPAFTSNQSAPFHIEGIGSSSRGTLLANPGENRAGALYLVKEITGPTRGAWSLELQVDSPRAYRAYLNGELLVDNLGLAQEGSAWDLFWKNQLRRPRTVTGAIRPGRNILAISLHPENENSPELDLDIGLTALTSFPESADHTEMILLAEPEMGESSTSVQWFTSTASATMIRFGPALDQMTNLISVPESTFIHAINIPAPPAGEQLYYEILRPDGSSYDPPATRTLNFPRSVLIPFESNWSYLDHRDPVSGKSIDPAISDSDFYETWSTQSFGSYPGHQSYDGPAFSDLQPAPFGPATSLNPPATMTPDLGAYWFLKEIDGGETGYHQLQVSWPTGCPITIFLNGERIGQFLDQPESQPIWAQYGTNSQGSPVALPTSLVLPPGPNLIAVLKHRQRPQQFRTFDLELTGMPVGNENTPPHASSVESTSVKLSWRTSSPQPTRLRWGTKLINLDQSHEDSESTNFHTHTISNLTPSTRYFFEILDQDGESFEPPVWSTFFTKNKVLISRESDGWSVLESIDGGTLVDPAVADPNFLTTWHTPASYDGPTFLPGQSAPFVSRNQHLRVGQTPLQTIDNFIRPVWLLKEFDGGTTGYRNLTLSGIYNRGFAAYLNGQLVALEGIDAGGSLGSWDLSSPLNDSYDTNFSRQIPGNIIATPGTNTLAIALHPRQFESPGFLTGEFEVRGIPLGLAISQPSLFANTFNNFRLSWQTSQPTSFQLFLGPDPLQLELVAEENDFSTSRDVQMPEFESGGTHYYEVHVADIFGNPLVYTGAFDLYPAIMREPFLQMASPTSMTVKWRTRSPGASIIRYGQDPDNLNQTATGTNTAAPFVILGRPDLSNLVTDHCVTLEGLSPSSKYYYQVGPAEGGQPGSEQQHFTTPPVQGTRAPTRIWVVGDSGAPGPGVRGMRDSYMDYAGDTPADLLLMLGDNAYNSGYDQEYQRAMFDIFPDILRTTPVWPTMGNHDHYSDDYYGIFELPTQGQSGGVPSGTEQYYSFDYGNIHFVCLNSEEDPPGMLEWLRNDLQSTRSDWVIAFFHHGPYTKGSHDSDTESEHFPAREQYLPILESYGVDLVLSGHSHQYERSNFLNGHYGLSSTYRPQDHAIDEGPGSSAGFTDRTSGLFNYGSTSLPYQKTIASPHAGHVSATVGASSIVSRWADGSANITNPHPHPVHVATIRALGSMVIDVAGDTLEAIYLDADGQIRDHFQIQQSPEVSPAIAWWQARFGPGSYPYPADWHANPDQDQHNNLEEFVLGGNPLVKDQLLEARLVTESSPGEPDQEWFTVQYRLREGTTAVVEQSENLVTFSTQNVTLIRRTFPDQNQISQWEARVPRTGQRTVFFRIQTSR
ncbi:MAG: fibronectin type III domain-containing protein [Akkermansiaceae bacterium]